jgi:nucleoside-diphosphate-sugar epimerase
LDCLKFGGESIIDIWHDPNFSFFNVDINNREELDQVLRKHDYEAVIHLAAIVGDPACKRESELAIKTNWESSKWLLDKCMELEIPRFAFASTCSNYGKMEATNSYVDENSPLSPASLYAEMKVKFEQYLLHEVEKKEKFCPTSLRFSTVYGLSPRMRFDLTVNEFTKDLALGKELIVFGEQFWRPYCHVADFSRAFMTVLESRKENVAYQVYNVGATQENYTKQMIVDEIKKQIPEAKIKYVHKDEDPRDYRVNFEKIRNELGFEVSKTYRTEFEK